MNRRSFFTRIARAAVIAVAAPVILREAICAELKFDLNAYRKAWAEFDAEWCLRESFRMARLADSYERAIAYYHERD